MFTIEVRTREIFKAGAVKANLDSIPRYVPDPTLLGLS